MAIETDRLISAAPTSLQALRRPMVDAMIRPNARVSPTDRVPTPAGTANGTAPSDTTVSRSPGSSRDQASSSVVRDVLKRLRSPDYALLGSGTDSRIPAECTGHS